MSMQYEQPQTVEQVNQELTSNPSVSQSTINAINALIAPPGASEVVVGSYNGSTVTAPSGQIPQLVVANIAGNVGSSVTMPIPVELQNSGAWVIDSDVNVAATWGLPVRQSSNAAHSLPQDAREATGVSQGVSRVISSGNGNDELSILDNGNTTIDGSNGNDTLILSAGYDSITGNIGNDSILAGAGDDTVVSGIGIDTVDGGLGFDVIQLAGAFDNWAATAEGDGVAISGAPGSGNAVEAINIDFISFTGATGNQTSIVVTSNEQQANAMRLYQGLLDRSADQGGSQYWLNQVNDGVSDVAIANTFIGSPEYVAKYGTQTNTQFVQQLYENALNRSAEQAGLDFWVNALDSGVSRGVIAVTIVGSPEGQQTIDNVILVTGIV